MNRIYKTIYNYTRKCIIVCNELSARRKSNNPSKGSIALIGAILLGLASTNALSKVTIAGVVDNEPTSSEIGVHQFFGADGSTFYIDHNRWIREKTSSPNSYTAQHNLPTYKKNTYYFGTGKDYNGAFTDFQIKDSALFIGKISGSVSNGKNTIYVTYTALEKTGDNQITHRDIRSETFTCTYNDPNCLNFIGKLEGTYAKDIPKIQALAPKLQPFLKGPSGSDNHDTVLNGSFTTSLRVTGVADGEISATSFDAVNGKQIWELQQKLGAGSEFVSVNTTDSIASPLTSAKAQGAHATAVGETAIASGSNSLGSSCIVVGEEPFRQIKSLIEIGPGRFGKGISIAEQNSKT